jgi:lipoprotein-anchoring transpeptidase ErfK/SrfK
MGWKGGLALALALGAAVGPGAAHVRVDVDLGAQVMRVAADTGESYEWPISSGSFGRATPRGEFRPYALYPMVHSWKYGNEPMPHSIFFHGQYAIHGTLETDLLGRPASHGCIRLSPRAAATLYQLVSREGAVIRIGGGPEFVAEPPSLRLIALPMGRALEVAPADSPSAR